MMPIVYCFIVTEPSATIVAAIYDNILAVITITTLRYEDIIITSVTLVNGRFAAALLPDETRRKNIIGWLLVKAGGASAANITIVSFDNTADDGIMRLPWARIVWWQWMEAERLPLYCSASATSSMETYWERYGYERQKHGYDYRFGTVVVIV